MKRVFCSALAGIILASAFSYNKVSAASYLWPVPGVTTATTYDGHGARDLPANIGTEVIAATSGTVEMSYSNICYHVSSSFGHNCTNIGLSGTYGNFLKIRNDDGNYTIYAHFMPDTIKFKKGDYVNAGDVLGLVGSSGASTGPHLHFEIRNSGNQKLEPLDFINPNATTDKSEVTLTGATLPNTLHTPNTYHWVKGVINSKLPIKSIKGGVYKELWDEAVKNCYHEYYPSGKNIYTYDLNGEFNDKLIFNDIPESSQIYHYAFFVEDISGTLYPFHLMDFKVGYAEPVCSHTYSEWKIITEPSCTNTGLRQMECTSCGDIKSEEISPSGHDYLTTVIDSTESEHGYSLHVCLKCKDNYKDNYTEVLKPLIKGDVNSDGNADLTDVTLLSLFLIGDTELSDIQLKAADTDGNEEVNLADLAALKQYLSKIIISL